MIDTRKISPFVIAVIFLCSCDQKAKPDSKTASTDELIKAVNDKENTISGYRMLLSLDHMAVEFDNDKLAARLSRVKECLRTRVKSDPFIVSACFDRNIPEKKQTIFAINYWDKRNTVRTIHFLAKDRRVIASGSVPWELNSEFEMPLRFFFLKLRKVSGVPRKGFVDSIVLEIKGHVKDVAFVALVEESGKISEATPVDWIPVSE